MTSLRLTSCGNKMKEIGLFALALFAGTLGYGMVWYSMIWYVRTKGYVNGKRVPNFSVRHFLDGLHKVLAYNIKVCTDTACNPNQEGTVPPQKYNNHQRVFLVEIYPRSPD